MHIFSLQSGSHGNCVFVEAGGVQLLLDAGISGKRTLERLSRAGSRITDLTAVIISHDHRDHVASAGVLQRKFHLPLYVTEPTLQTAARRVSLGKLGDVRYFSAGQTLQFGRVCIETIRTPHDASDGVAFVVDDGRRRLGILTDLGHHFDGLSDVLSSLDAVFLESNYDPEMLHRSDYPEWLKQRIRGRRGHLSNEECAELVTRSGKRLQWVCLAHLSDNNNTPERACATFLRIAGDRLPLHVAPHFSPGRLLRIA